MKDLNNTLVLFASDKSVVKPLSSIDLPQRLHVFGVYFDLQAAFRAVRFALSDRNMGI